MASLAERRIAWLLAGAVLALNLLALLAAAVYLDSSEHSVLREIETRTNSIADILDHGISGDAGRVDMALRTVVDALQQQLEDGPQLQPRRVDRLLQQQQELIGSHVMIRATDASGRVRYANDLGQGAPASYADRDFFPALRDHADAGLWVTSPILGRVGHVWVVAFVRRYTDAQGRFAGVVSAAVPLSYFSQLLQVPDLGAKGIALLRDAHGGLIARYPPDPKSPIGQRRYSPELQQAIDSGARSVTFRAARTGDGIERIDSYRRLTLPPFHLVAGVSTDEALQPWRHQRDMVLLALLAFALFSSAAGWLLWRSIVEARREMLRSQALLRSASDGIHVLDSGGNVVEASDAFCRMLGYAMDEVIGLNLHRWVAEVDAERIDKVLHWLLFHPAQQTFEARYRRKDGTVLDVELTTLPLQLGGRPMLFAAARDISERRRTEAQLRIAAVAFQSRDGLMVTDAAGTILQVNQSFCQVTGYSVDEVIGQRPSMLTSGRQDRAFYRTLWEAIGREGHWEGQIWNRRKDGGIYPEWLSISAVRDAAGTTTHYIASYSDVSDPRAAERRILELAFYDPLTGLPNRRLLLDRLQQALGTSQRSKRWGAVLLLDLDHFKTINDSRGHDFGDLMLVETAMRLRASLRSSDSAARLGGDEFVVLLEDLGSDAASAANTAEHVAEKLLAALQRPLERADAAVHPGCSIGVALFDGAEDSIENLLKQADLAMYAAKAAGRATIRFFNPQMQAAIDRRVAIESGLRHALQGPGAELQLHYQPQVDAAGRVIGAEALLRWTSAQFGVVAPGEFIPVAEDSNLILELGAFVLEQACGQLAVWSADPHKRDWVVAVNVSARQFRQRDFAARVESALQRTQAPAARLKLELTESLLLHDVEQAVATMQAVGALGVAFSLDDFGTGYSSLAYLKRLPLQQLKIDASFVRDIVDDVDDRAIVQAVIGLGDSLGLQVLAEGVETTQQLALLRELGCRLFQGNYFSPARPVSDLTDGPLG